MPYTFDRAFEDVSRAVLASGDPLEYDRRVIAAQLLHTIVRAAHALGLPAELDDWPGGHPGPWVVGNVRAAGPEPLVREHERPGGSSAWALREAAAEIRSALVLSPGELAAVPAELRAGFLAGHDQEYRVAGLLDQQAADMIDDGLPVPGPADLAEYDAGLVAWS